MFTEQHADVFESIYRSRGKDWRKEALDIVAHIRSRFPEADSLLDVACGSGIHLETFAERFGHTEGLEIAEPMIRYAAKRLRDVPLHQGDMRSFDLGRTFDAVCCMFCSIAYLDTVADMRDAVRSMAAHLVPGGVLVVEPWWFPEQFIEGYVAGDLSREPDRTITRVSHSVRQGGKTRMELKFVIGEAGGLTEFTEIEILSLFTKDDYLSAFTDAGCSVEYLEGGPTGRGLFVGIRR
ncbi:bifunctional 2-polyprenyl-6-hydroxyphenol methylase/3-demethylubiquinol 3-O-methyltransferase UbiG [Amycolatopsis sp. YIM 10]|uniref:class I SAM-dependent methyltransferase n=1 Tax=Amycolatopsis sp. YIM 10 TaxID=2653857 RepID=UPI0012907A2C|nr:class I SAM-dependent methyltransferase [Amycolatopsis sp. YIM 10]QFU89744.1 dTDP-3-amino-3,4,6-trideoxy-alpha-D-glucopyranose [Amycolatopsis sp. YIM 10]